MAEETLGCYNIFDLREIALKRVPKGLFEFVDRGIEDEVSLRHNRSIFERVLALLGCRDVAELRLEFLIIEDGLFRTATTPRANIRLVESAKVALL